jgi:hypothetical protein
MSALTGLDYRIAISLFSKDGKRAVDVCEFSNGETYLDENGLKAKLSTTGILAD